MALEGLKVISYGYKDMDINEINNAMTNYNAESPEFRQILE